MHSFTTIAALLSAASTVLAAPTLVERSTSWTSETTPKVLLPQSNNWQMLTWTGTSCTGTELVWSTSDGSSCTNLAAVSSLKVTRESGCKTTYYSGQNCNGSPVRAEMNGCDGYSQGERIESFSVDC